ncbi:hypothetical protein GF407_02260 [candidate division KSB1 bacterium]|nr:hypothetical protein [candidate division KSB1 bacterium]
MDNLKKIVVVLLFVSILFVPALYSQIKVDVETGAVFSGYNDVRIPGDSGTLFSLSEELQADSEFFYRIRLFYDFNPRHHLGVLFAPLSINSTGQLDHDLVFFGETFPAQTPLTTTWMFNSYRLIYRYDFLRREKLELGIGFTAKIRDALIRVEGNGLEAEKTNVGFVPILHFRAKWWLSDRLALLLDGDALAAPQGRAEDVLAALMLQVNDHIEFKAGYRLLEGGADNDEVYNFALVHYASFGAVVSF